MRKTVLLIDDEDIVRAVLARTLREAGYDVIEANNGLQALEILVQTRQPVDLVIADVLLPILGGRRLADRFGRDHPELRVLWMSGSPVEEYGRFGEMMARQFMQKPVSSRQLLAAVKCVLSEPKTSSEPGA